MRKIDFGLGVRLSLVTAFVILAIYLQSYLLNSASQSFYFSQYNTINLVTYSIIGLSISLISINIFKKSVWKITFRPELLVFVLLYFIVASSQVLMIGFIVNIFLQLGISPTLGLIPFQVLFGYSLLHLFLVKGNN